MNNKVVVIGGGTNASLHAEVAKRLEANNVFLVESESLSEEMYIITDPYKEYFPFTIATGSKEKPTCSRHHEYVEHTTREGNIIHSEWKCRFCNKPLK